MGLKVYFKKTVFLGVHSIFTYSDTFAVGLSCSHNAQRHRQTDRQTVDRRQ